LFSSCENEKYSFSEYQPITLDSSNVDFDVLNNGFLLTTIIPYKASTISISPNCRNQTYPTVTSVVIDGKSVSESDPFIGDGPYLEERPILYGDWGSIYYENIQNNYIVNIRLNTNNKDIQRIVQIQLGYGYEYVVIEIIQLGNDDI